MIIVFLIIAVVWLFFDIRRLKRKKGILTVVGLILDIIIISGLIFLCIYIPKRFNKSLNAEKASLHWQLTYQENYQGGVSQDLLGKVVSYNEKVQEVEMSWKLAKYLTPWVDFDCSYLEINGVTVGVDDIR